MFSWTDYFNNDNNEKCDIKVLKKSDLSQILNEETFSSSPKIDKHRQCNKNRQVKKTSESNHGYKQTIKGSKILDLSPEEKQKIAALIRELGVIQVEKEKVSNELIEERNKFQLEITSMERMYKMTLEDKDKLEAQLRKKDEEFKCLEKEGNKKSMNEPRLDYTKEQFVIIPQQSLRHIQHSYTDAKIEERYIPGPPQSSRSQRLTSDLLRTHSLQSIDQDHQTNRHSLMKEQSDLLVEKQYLNLVLKQQKCLKKLTGKIARLEHESLHSKLSTGPSLDNCETSSTVTDLVDIVTPRILNDATLDSGSHTPSLSSTSISHHTIGNIANSPLPNDYSASPTESYLLKKDDVLLISALNEGITDRKCYNLSSSLKTSQSVTSTRTHSPSDSLFQIINTLDELQLGDNASDVQFCQSPFKVSFEEDILNELFFNI